VRPSWGSLRGLGGGLVLIALANGALLAGVAWNRGAREAEVTLTEREFLLAAPAEDEEDTGLALPLDWSPRWVLQDERPEWLDRRKLAALGFDVSVPPGSPRAAELYRRALPRTAFVALELEGEAWRRWLRRQEEELAQLRREVASGRKGTEVLEVAERSLVAKRRGHTRLFAVDAGQDAAALRARYPNRHRYLILRGTVRLTLQQPEGKRPYLAGSVADLAVDRLHVSLRFRPLLDQVIREDRARQDALARRTPPGEPIGELSPEPDFRATVAVGRRYEPWLLSVERLPAPPR
jgi:hypothetical protein